MYQSTVFKADYVFCYALWDCYSFLHLICKVSLSFCLFFKYFKSKCVMLWFIPWLVGLVYIWKMDKTTSRTKVGGKSGQALKYLILHSVDRYFVILVVNGNAVYQTCNKGETATTFVSCVSCRGCRHLMSQLSTKSWEKVNSENFEKYFKLRFFFTFTYTFIWWLVV